MAVVLILSSESEKFGSRFISDLTRVGLKIGSQCIGDLAMSGIVAEYKSVAKPVSRLLDVSALEVKYLAYSKILLKARWLLLSLIHVSHSSLLKLGTLIEMVASTWDVVAGFFVKGPPQHDSDM